MPKESSQITYLELVIRMMNAIWCYEYEPLFFNSSHDKANMFMSKKQQNIFHFLRFRIEVRQGQ